MNIAHEKFETDLLQKDLIRQGNEEVLNLKKYLNGMSDEDIVEDTAADAVRKILTTAIGLEKIDSVLGYFDTMEETANCPQLVDTEDCLRVWGGK